MKRGNFQKTTVLGYGWMAIAVLIWASWLVFTASGQTTSLSIFDLAAFRAVIPALVLTPLLWRDRHALVRLGLGRCLILSAYGAPFILCVGMGLGFAPVAHAGAMVPGLMPVFSLVIGWRLLGQHPRPVQVAGTLLILAGVIAIVLGGPSNLAKAQEWVGHLLFLLAACCWASFSIAVRALSVPPFLATGIVAAVSAALVVPVWVLSDLSNLRQAQAHDIAFQAVFQGVVSGLLSVVAFSRALRLIGNHATTLSALTPSVATALAIPILGQVPDIQDVLALVLVVIGLGLQASTSATPNTDLLAAEKFIPSATQSWAARDRSPS